MRPRAIVTGCNGLVGAEAVNLLCEEGYEVYGIDNDMRRFFFGPDASTEHRAIELMERNQRFGFYKADVGDATSMRHLFKDIASSGRVELIVHTAAQPSHDWAAREPQIDFGVNANGTLNLLIATREHFPEATFAHISTSKVYGDNPNKLQLWELSKRFDVDSGHQYYHGIDTTMSVEGCLHSLFGVSKLSGDLLVQEFGRYFKMNTVCFRPGCVTGPGHAGAELHGFLSYLVKCAVTGSPYTIFGYKGLQVRCNIYGRDLAAACLAFHQNPQHGAVYNIGGGRENSVSMLEAIELAEEVTGNHLSFTYEETPRIGDHMWWISSNEAFQRDYPAWAQTRTVREMIEEIAEAL